MISIESSAGALTRRQLPSFGALRSFECAARHESFTKAAEELSLTQGAVSRQVKELEVAVGLQLFRRVGRRVVLTDAGRAFASEVTVDLERLRQTLTRAIAAGSTQTALRVATLPTFTGRWLIPRLADFEKRHPRIQVNFLTRLEPFDMTREHFDLAVHFGDPVWPDGELTRLFGETLVPVASPMFRKRWRLNEPLALLKAPLLHLETRPRAWHDWFAHMGIQTREAIEGKRFDHFTMIIAAAANDLGAALLPRYLIEKELDGGALVALNSSGFTTTNAYYLVRHRGDRSPGVDLFADWLLDATSALRS
jgi:LysR family glycine cleavage system transcriptional activator